MAGKHGRSGRRSSRSRKRLRLLLAVCAIAAALVVGALGAQFLEERMNVKVENAGMQMTAYTGEENTAQVFVNGQWYRKKNVETLLVIGVDDFGTVTGSDSYVNTNQADFMVLLIRDVESGENSVIHLNRDTMTDITMLGITGEKVGTKYAQLTLAFNYGRGYHDSSMNTAEAVSRLLYGMNVDHYITVTMDAVPILNDWAGGVTVEVMDDMTGADSALVPGAEIKLTGEQALVYVRTRKGLDDSTNINRMKRQRQYASAWIEQSGDMLDDQNAVMQLIVQLSDYHDSDCTAEELSVFAAEFGDYSDTRIYELPGEAVQGEEYMEFYADDAGIQQLVLELFYEPVR